MRSSHRRWAGRCGAAAREGGGRRVLLLALALAVVAVGWLGGCEEEPAPTETTETGATDDAGGDAGDSGDTSGGDTADDNGDTPDTSDGDSSDSVVPAPGIAGGSGTENDPYVGTAPFTHDISAAAGSTVYYLVVGKVGYPYQATLSGLADYVGVTMRDGVSGETLCIAEGEGTEDGRSCTERPESDLLALRVNAYSGDLAYTLAVDTEQESDTVIGDCGRESIFTSELIFPNGASKDALLESGESKAFRFCGIEGAAYHAVFLPSGTTNARFAVYADAARTELIGEGTTSSNASVTVDVTAEATQTYHALVEANGHTEAVFYLEAPDAAPLTAQTSGNGTSTVGVTTTGGLYLDARLFVDVLQGELGRVTTEEGVSPDETLTLPGGEARDALFPDLEARVLAHIDMDRDGNKEEGDLGLIATVNPVADPVLSLNQLQFQEVVRQEVSVTAGEFTSVSDGTEMYCLWSFEAGNPRKVEDAVLGTSYTLGGSSDFNNGQATTESHSWLIPGTYNLYCILDLDENYFDTEDESLDDAHFSRTGVQVNGAGSSFEDVSFQ